MLNFSVSHLQFWHNLKFITTHYHEQILILLRFDFSPISMVMGMPKVQAKKSIAISNKLYGINGLDGTVFCPLGIHTCLFPTRPDCLRLCFFKDTIRALPVKLSTGKRKI